MDFSDASAQLPNSDLINAALHSLKEAESDALFAIALHKDQIFRRKKVHFKSRPFKKIIVIRNQTNFGHLCEKSIGNKIVLMESDFLIKYSIDEIKKKFEGSLVITTNNIFSSIGVNNFSTLYQDTPRTIYAVHDYDNHHWLQNSAQIALLSDVYIPAHQENLLICTRLNPNVLGGIPCGTNQWTKEFIEATNCDIHKIKRGDMPLGKYYFYEKFIQRNKIIKTLEETYPSITLLTNDFHSLSQKEKWDEWTSHKLHWIVPVLNDLPIRFFDALITGGLPLVPRGLVPFIEALGIPKNFYSVYGPLDILEPKKLIENNLRLFNDLGIAGISARHQYALQNFHIDKICEKIVSHIERIYCRD